MLFGIFGLGIVEMAVLGAIVGAVVGAVIYMLSGSDKGGD